MEHVLDREHKYDTGETNMQVLNSVREPSPYSGNRASNQQ